VCFPTPGRRLIPPLAPSKMIGNREDGKGLRHGPRDEAYRWRRRAPGTHRRLWNLRWWR